MGSTMTGKVLYLAAFIIVLSLASIGINEYGMLRLGQSQTATATAAEGTRALSEAQNAQWQLRFGISQYLAVPNPDDRHKIIEDSPKWFANLDKAIDRYGKLPLNDAQRAALANFQTIYGQYRDARPQWFALMEEGKIEEAAEWRKKTILKSGGESVKALSELIALQNSLLLEVNDKASSDIKASGYINSVMALGLVGGIIIGFFLFLRILKAPLLSLTQSVNSISNGNVSQAIAGTDRRDEFGPLAQALEQWRRNLIDVQNREQLERERLQQNDVRQRSIDAATKQFDTAVRQTLDNIRTGIDQLHQVSKALTSDATTLENVTQNVSNATLEATQNVETAAAAGTELSQSIREISRHVQDSAATAQTLADEAKEATSKINGLALAANKIGEIVSMINDIASQTNLLALNATIESARAGEAGKGFAIVAHEVKNLAGQTSKATDDIASQVATIQSETNSVVQAIERISGTTAHMSEMSGMIASAVEEQGAATAEIANSVEAASQRTSQVSDNIGSVTDAALRNKSQAHDIFQFADLLLSESQSLAQKIEGFLNEVRR